MIKWLKEQPVPFRHLEEEHRYLAVFKRMDRGYTLCAFVAIRVDDSSKMGVVHVHPIKEAWSHQSLKQMKTDWPQVVEEFKRMGCHQILATSAIEYEHFAWWKRFIRHFGFPEPMPVYVSHQEV